LTKLSFFVMFIFMKRTCLQKLLEWKNKQDRKPLILKGVRQVGKTYLLKEFGKAFFTKYHYINFERNPNLFEIFSKNLDPRRIVEDLSFHLNKKIDINNDLLIFDEIQECPKALTSLKYFQEELPELNLCSAGSLLGIYLGDASFPVGKVDMITLYPMSFTEFLKANNEEQLLNVINNFGKEKSISETAHKLIWEKLKHYFITGGMPEIVSVYCKYKKDPFKAFIEVRKKQESIVLAYFADMAKHSGNVNAMHLNRLFKSVPAQLEKAMDGSTEKFKFKDIVPGISHYSRLVNAIDWLENMGLIIKVHIVNYGKQPFAAYSKENAFKLFLFDIGILGSLCNLSPKTILNYDYGSYKGYFAENFVLQELLYSGKNPPFCWHEKKSEIEFLLEKNGDVIPVEVKSGNITKSKSLSIFSLKYNPKFSIVLSAKPYNYLSSKKTYYTPLYMVEQI
jgi:uncharacterized protein